MAMGAQLVEQPEMRAFADIVVVHRPEHRPEAVGIVTVHSPPSLAASNGCGWRRIDVDHWPSKKAARRDRV
jgi:hypothetical protein